MDGRRVDDDRRMVRSVGHGLGISAHTDSTDEFRMSLSALIVDAERTVRERLHQLLVDTGDFGLLTEAATVSDGVRAVNAMGPDAVFLGVHRNDDRALDLVDMVAPYRIPATVVVADYEEFAVKAFEMGAVYCLTNPIDPGRLQCALTRLRQSLSRPLAAPGSATRLVAAARQQRGPVDRLVVPERGRYAVVDSALVHWLEAEGNYVRIHLDGQSYRIRWSMETLLARLDAATFRRIYRSTVVNIDFVVDICSGRDGHRIVTMVDGTQLPLSRTYGRNMLS